MQNYAQSACSPVRRRCTYRLTLRQKAPGREVQALTRRVRDRIARSHHAHSEKRSIVRHTQNSEYVPRTLRVWLHCVVYPFDKAASVHIQTFENAIQSIEFEGSCGGRACVVLQSQYVRAYNCSTLIQSPGLSEITQVFISRQDVRMIEYKRRLTVQSVASARLYCICTNA